jgi:hypothetical protein
MNDSTNIFTRQEATKRSRHHKILTISSVVVLASLLLTILVLNFHSIFPSTPKEETPITLVTPPEEVKSRIEILATETNKDLSGGERERERGIPRRT